MTSKYAEVGVDVKKKGIDVFEDTTKNLYPNAFCTVAPDPDNKDYGILLHTDGAGSKPVQNYLHWKETGDTSWFEGIAQDVIAMNIDDVICVGAKSISFVDYIAINPCMMPKEEVLAALNNGFKNSLEVLKDNEVEMTFLGGETADLPDQLRTLDVSGTVAGRVKLDEAITGQSIKSGDVIIGLRSAGKAKYEKIENSGMMCNGITLARHSLMKSEYSEKYPEIGGGAKYYGKFAFDEEAGELGMTVGEAILSPTRLFAPVITKILEKKRESVHGLVHNTGGGQTKCLKLGENIRYIKDDPLPPEPLFRLIQESSKSDWKEMYEDFNMGTGIDIITSPDEAEDILSISEKLGVDGKIIGKCEKGKGRNTLTLVTEFGKFEYGG